MKNFAQESIHNAYKPGELFKKFVIEFHIEPEDRASLAPYKYSVRNTTDTTLRSLASIAASDFIINQHIV